MANEINIVAPQTGLSLSYRLLVNGAVFLGPLALNESSPGFYVGTVPMGTAPGTYLVVAYNESDSPISVGELHWLGDRELDPKNLNDLHLIHGLRQGSTLSVSKTERTAGSVSQTIEEAGGTVTVTRV